MSYSSVFASIMKPLLEPEGYKRKGSELYCYKPEEQIVKVVRLDMMHGNRAFRLEFGVGCFADEIVLGSGKQKRLALAALDISWYLGRRGKEQLDNLNWREENGDVIAYLEEDFREKMMENAAVFMQELYPEFSRICDVESLYAFRKYDNALSSRSKSGFAPSHALLYEAIQCGRMDEAKLIMDEIWENWKKALPIFFADLDRILVAPISKTERDIVELHDLKTRVQNEDMQWLNGRLGERIEASRTVCKTFFGQ